MASERTEAGIPVADTDDISRCFDHCARARAKRRGAGGPRGVSKALLALLERAGLDGLSVLELGCGTGEIGRAHV